MIVPAIAPTIAIIPTETPITKLIRLVIFSTNLLAPCVSDSAALAAFSKDVTWSVICFHCSGGTLKEPVLVADGGGMLFVALIEIGFIADSASKLVSRVP